MEKEHIKKLAEELHREAFDANSYYLIMKQYRESRAKYKEAMTLSPAFYGVVYDALQKACFMEIAKLYDKSTDTVTIGSLLKMCADNKDYFSEYRGTIEVEDDGIHYQFQAKYQHWLRPEEERFFADEVRNQRQILKIFGVDGADNNPAQVELTFSEFIVLLKKRLQSLRKKQDAVTIQRNKIYAHNDEIRMIDEDSVLKKYPLFYSDIQELIDFALEVTGFVFAVLTGEEKATQYSNIDDWEGTLMLSEKGLKYQEIEMKQMMNPVSIDHKSVEEENHHEHI